ncbi:PREDICTED: retinol-binding protein 5 [Calidris pugnax]|uniref:retinol-binding protein 5 n=1 Tax=Calidris pugnax TaxID=198806 RepID=UPI00071D986D|nr:PREDICTED: retinol-binding protein 5 [Calidris pugnax]
MLEAGAVPAFSAPPLLSPPPGAGTLTAAGSPGSPAGVPAPRERDRPVRPPGEGGRSVPAPCLSRSSPSLLPPSAPGMPPNLTGYYRFVSQENMDNYLRALDINVVLRKLVCLLKPDKEIIHTGDHMVIRTITSLRDYVMDFDLGVQFEEDLGPVDGRKCQTTVSWEGDQLVCEQLGEKRNRGWRHWLEGDQLHLVRRGSSSAS